jgi:hypothetical protein
MTASDRDDPYAWVGTTPAAVVSPALEEEESRTRSESQRETLADAASIDDAQVNVASVRPSLKSPISKRKIPGVVQAREAPVSRNNNGATAERPHRISGYVRSDISLWLRKLEHTERSDGTYFASQSELVSRLVEIAKAAIEEGRVRL